MVENMVVQLGRESDILTIYAQVSKVWRTFFRTRFADFTKQEACI